MVIDYKSQSFEGLHNREELRGLMIEMDFDKEGGEWRLIHLEVKSIPYKVRLIASMAVD